MTTTVTAQLPRSSSHRFRRDVIAALAGATLFAASALVVNRIDDASHQAGGVAATNESPIDLTTINGTTPVASGPIFDATVVSPPMRLVVNEALSEACAMGHPDACPFAHKWVPDVVELVGIEDVVRGLGLRLAE